MSSDDRTPTGATRHVGTGILTLALLILAGCASAPPTSEAANIANVERTRSDRIMRFLLEFSVSLVKYVSVASKVTAECRECPPFECVGKRDSGGGKVVASDSIEFLFPSGMLQRSFSPPRGGAAVLLETGHI